MSAVKERAEPTGLWPLYSFFAMAARRFGLIVIGLMVVVSAVVVAHQTHELRLATTEYKQLEQEQQVLDLQWQKLRLEQSALSEPGRVERIAEEQLNMQQVDVKEEIIIDGRESNRVKSGEKQPFSMKKNQ